MVNIETLLVEFFNNDEQVRDAGLEASTDIPLNRPKRFITVERVGGDTTHLIDEPLVAVQVWAESRWQASELAGTVLTRMYESARYLPEVARLEVAGLYNFPDPDSGQARYQMTVTLVTKPD